jgi:hypothetical protein
LPQNGEGIGNTRELETMRNKRHRLKKTGIAETIRRFRKRKLKNMPAYNLFDFVAKLVGMKFGGGFGKDSDDWLRITAAKKNPSVAVINSQSVQCVAR